MRPSCNRNGGAFLIFSAKTYHLETKTRKDQTSEPASLVELTGFVYEYLRSYVDVKADQAKLEVVERLSKTASALFRLLIVGTMGLLAAVFGLIALAFYIGSQTGSLTLGFGLVAGVFVLLGVLLHLLRRPLLTNPIIEFIIRKIYE